MPEKEPLFQVWLEDCKFDLFEMICGQLSSLATFDYAFFKRIQEKDGSNKAIELYKSLWLLWIEDYINGVREELGIHKIDNLSKLSTLLRYALEKKGCVFNIVEETSNRLVLSITKDPLLEFHKEQTENKVDTSYIRALSEMGITLMKELVNNTDLQGFVEVNQDLVMAKGDKFDRFIFEMKRTN
jgi:hypothetical protein